MSMEQSKVFICTIYNTKTRMHTDGPTKCPIILIQSYDDCHMLFKMRVSSTSHIMVEPKPKLGSICFRVDSGKEIYNHLDRRVFGLDAEVNSCSNQVSHTQNGIMRPAMSFRVEEWWAIRLVCLAMDGLLGRLE